MPAPTTDSDGPAAYEALVRPRFTPIAEALVAAARLAPGERALELGAGTGLVTRLAAPAVAPGLVVATDVSAPMLAVAARVVRAPNVLWSLVDHNRPLPFLDAGFDIVLGGLTSVQESAAALAEVVRVLRPGGRLALAMWGTSYGEVQLATRARRRIGRPGFTSAAPGRALRRLERAGFVRVERHDLALEPRFESVEEYLRYRRGFGVPTGSGRAAYDRLMEALRAEAEAEAAPDGSLTLGWKLVVLVAATRA